MQFLADVFVPCDQCDGKRFKPQVLEVRYRGRSIHQVLDLTVREALTFFSSSPKVLRRLQVLDEIGLVSPEVARRRREGAGWYSEILARRKPEWIVARAGTLRSGAAFAGIAAPFRSEAERDAALQPYRIALASDTLANDQTFYVLRRR
jgi:hypothetical protein